MAKPLIEVLGENIGKGTSLVDLHEMEQRGVLKYNWQSELVELLSANRVKFGKSGVYFMDPTEIVRWRKKNES